MTFLELISLFWSAIVSEFESVVTEKIKVQLCVDSKVKFTDSVTDTKIPQHANDLNGLLKGSAEDEITWNITLD